MKTVAEMNIETTKTINPVVKSVGVSSVDMIEVLLSIVSLMLSFLLKIDNAFLGGSIIGFLGLILTDRDLTSFTQVALIF